MHPSDLHLPPPPTTSQNTNTTIILPHDHLMHDYGDHDWLRGRLRNERNNGQRCQLEQGHERDCCSSTRPTRASNRSPQIKIPDMWCLVDDNPTVATALAKKPDTVSRRRVLDRMALGWTPVNCGV